MRSLQKALRGDKTISAQDGVSLPMIQRYVERLLKGDVAPAIKIDDNVIVEGNHRYSDSKVCEKAVFELCALDDLSCPPAEITDNPVWPRVSESLERIYEVGGFVELCVLGGTQGFVKRLYMKAVPGKYRLVILTRSSDPKAELQEWWESGSSEFRGVISFGDDEWDARTVCSDLSVAKVIFKEFFDNGDLSNGLLQMRSQWDPKP